MNSNCKFVIIGLGVTGLSCAKFLAKFNEDFIIVDTREQPPLLAELQSKLPAAKIILGCKSDNLPLAKIAVVSPGMSLTDPMIQFYCHNQAEIIGDVELFARHVKVPVIAITGTNAKSTVTTLVAKMLQAAGKIVAVGGNLGVPALDLLSETNAEVMVLELSSFQLETTYSLRPTVATILNISEDHLDRHGTIENYIQAKRRIYSQAAAIVVNADDANTDFASNDKISFTLGQPGKQQFGIISANQQRFLSFGEEKLLNCAELPVPGSHYQANALAAMAICYKAGIDFSAMITTLKQFLGLAHRCEVVRTLQQVLWINDSKGTNIGATQAALKGIGAAIEGSIILIAGGVGKGADFRQLIPEIQQFVSYIILFGQDAAVMAQAFDNIVSFQQVENLSAAVSVARQLAQPNDCVLLSPACASYDMFKNFEHRGDVFKQLVNEL